MRVWGSSSSSGCGSYLILTLLIVLLPDHQQKRAAWSSPHLRRHRSKGIQWWNLAHMPQILNDESLFHHQIPLFVTPPNHPFTRKQLKLVTLNPGTLMALARGSRLAVDECQHQFRYRRWNCPTTDALNGRSIFGKVVDQGCMETAFIHALTTAALTYATARACGEGSIYTCSCGHREFIEQPTERSEWQWGGCSDNVDFGYRFSRDFTDVNEKERDIRCAMDLHNNEAGRLNVRGQMRQECKCHGMSGSCAIKTCWMKLPIFRHIGEIIKEKFDGAAKIDQGNDIRERSRFNLITANPDHKPPGQTDLVYYEESPSFCEPDTTISFKGIKNRECNATSMGIDGCEILCCGHGFRTDSYLAKERCNCIFHWCCRVTCETCTRAKDRHTCL